MIAIVPDALAKRNVESGTRRLPLPSGARRANVGAGGYLGSVSSRIHSEFGTLGERIAGMRPMPVERPVDPARHVWVTTASGRQAGLLVAWLPGADGTWWGKVAVADAPGDASLQLIDSTLLTPALTQAEGL